MFNEQSVITHINQGDETIPDTPEGRMFLDVCRRAMQISADTDGAFDITVAPLVNLWGFGFKQGTPPTPHSIDSIRRIVGYQKLTIGQAPHGLAAIHKSDPRMMLDCSAIAKGYGVDVVAQLLWDRGVRNFIVEIGGEVVTRGVNPQRVPWAIGVTKPVDDSLATAHTFQTILNVTDKAMATSGNYRNYYYKDGRKYAHTVDPHTGRPVQHSLLSATVLADDCATADAYATAFMVMGLDSARTLLRRHPELMAYLIYSSTDGTNATWYSPTLRSKIQDN